MLRRVYLILLIYNLTLIQSANLQQYFRRTPDNQTATVGDTVTLACSIINKQGVLQWTRDGFGLGTDRNLNGYDRYRMVGSEEEGDYTLVIDSVKLEDDAVFQCQVGPGFHGVKGLRSANAKLTVEVPTRRPEILQGDFIETDEGKEIQLECSAWGGKPAAEITWLDGSSQEIKTNVKVIKEFLNDGKRFNTRSILTLTPKKEHNNKTFTCQAHNRPSKEVLADFIKLNVKYSPKIMLKIHNPNIREGDNVRITCKADANPGEMTYRWFLNGQIISGDSSTLILNNINRVDHNHIVECEVTNGVGRNEASTVLFVSYGPTFLQEPKTIQADLDASVTLSCLVDGNPKPELVWFHEETRVVISTQPNHTITVTPETAGKYICQAVVQGFPEISSETIVHLKGPPKIQSTKIQFGKVDDLINLECFVTSIPKATSINWSHSGTDIVGGSDETYFIKEDLRNGGVRSTLTIKSAKESDFGPYNCTVVNEYGTRVMEIFLMKQKNPQLMIILTAIIASVVFIVALATVTLLCQRKSSRKSNSLMNSDISLQVKNNNVNIKTDTSSNNSELKVEIRTASSLSNIHENESEHWNEDHSSDNKTDSLYRYNDFIESNYPPIKNNVQNNNGHIPQTNYSNLNGSAAQQQPVPSTHHYPMNIDPHYSATYGNPFLRVSNSNLPMPNHSVGNPLNNSHYSSTMPKPSTTTFSRTNTTPTPAPQTPQNPSLSLSTSSSTLHYVPSQATHHQLKPGTLATHV